MFLRKFYSPSTLCHSVLFPALRKSIMSQVAVKENGKDGEGQKGREREREQAAAAVDETGNRESEGCQMFCLGMRHIAIGHCLNLVNLESLVLFQTRSMERKGERRSMELRASLRKNTPIVVIQMVPTFERFS